MSDEHLYHFYMRVPQGFYPIFFVLASKAKMDTISFFCFYDAFAVKKS